MTPLTMIEKKCECGFIYTLIYFRGLRRLLRTIGGYVNNLSIKNKDERECYERLVNDGWKVLRKGYPDFICVKGDRVMAVEVKPKRFHRLKRFQYMVMEILSSKGISCWKYTPDGGFEIINKETPHVV